MDAAAPPFVPAPAAPADRTPSTRSRRHHRPRRHHPPSDIDDISDSVNTLTTAARSTRTANPLPPRTGRAARNTSFNVALTAPNTDQQAVVPATATSENLRERLTAYLTDESIDCPICILPIVKHHAISSCSACFAPFHLNCIREWAERSCEEVRERSRMMNAPSVEGSWRCPSCQKQKLEADIPRLYKCFCGRQTRPRPSNMATPHSCGHKCARSRPEGCPHPCASPCHPALCPPCQIIIRRPCHCGKEVKDMRCSTLHPTNADQATHRRIATHEELSCGKICGAKLDCGLHACDKLCHDGPCGTCLKEREKKCFCGTYRKEEPCDINHTAKDRVTCMPNPLQSGANWIGEYSCERPCPWTYDCGIHLEDAVCHPHPTAELILCPKSTSIVKNCPCGRTPLVLLLAQPRTSCTDPIPTCAKTCGRPLEACSHSCAAPCHEGPCPPCEAVVTQICICGSEKRTILCSSNAFHAKSAEFKCDRICKALRHCGKHQCGNKCCPLSYLEAMQSKRGSGKKARSLAALDDLGQNEDHEGVHVCDRICNKPLSCGTHTCPLNDHRGPCPPCLQSSFEELSCNCGQTVMMPPVSCGTTIVCDKPCVRPPPICGHPRAPHPCHETPDCPPCPFLTTRYCQCHKSIPVKNVRCSQLTVSCAQICGEPLACGGHVCRKICHANEGHEDCKQVCAKPRKLCGHPCPKPCHAPTTCPEKEPCPLLLDQTCACGHLKKRVRCGSCEPTPQGAGSKPLPCADSCAIARRNLALAEALGIKKDSRDIRSVAVEWPADLLKFYGENQNWCNNLATTIEELVLGQKPSHMLPAMKKQQREFVHNFVKKYCVGSESFDEEPHRSIMLTKTPMSAIPRPKLSDAWLIQNKPATNGHPVLITKKPTPTRLQFNAFYFEAVLGHDEASLRNDILKPFFNIPYTLRWVNDEDVLLIPSYPHPITATEIDRKIRSTQSMIRMQAQKFCKRIDGARVDADTEELLSKGEVWSSTAAGAGIKPSPTAWSANRKPVWSSNAFNKLEEAEVSTLPTFVDPVEYANAAFGPPVSASQPQASTSSSGIDVIGPGYNQPPRAVVAPENHDLKDSWDDE